MQEKIEARHSLRFKFVLVSILVEITMLGLLLGNSLRLMNATLEEQTQAKLQALTPLLDGALSSRLFERDHASVKEILGKLMSGGHAKFAYSGSIRSARPALCQPGRRRHQPHA